MKGSEERVPQEKTELDWKENEICYSWNENCFNSAGDWLVTAQLPSSFLAS
jgi:hypothetical protein